jgi:short subunit dehydrogenase-like uncharacterized protein
MSGDIWVLGATGRSGHGGSRRLRGTGHAVALAGRDATRLVSIAAELGDAAPYPVRSRRCWRSCGASRRRSS